jgi:hypothetical protein
MNKFDILYKQLMEQMVAGGASSLMGTPASGPVGSYGNVVGPNVDFWNNKSNVLAKSIFGTYQKRELKPAKRSRKPKK